VPFSVTDNSGRPLLKLEGAVTLRHAAALAAMLVEHGAPAAVDTSRLEEIDTCALQLLCSLRKTAPELSFDNPSEAFTRAAGRRGLVEELLGKRESCHCGGTCPNCVGGACPSS
jgi:hypothetical protein